MRVMFIGAAVSNHTMRWVNALSELGHDVLLVSHRDNYRDNREEISPNVHLRYLRFGGGAGYIANAPELRRIFREYKPDIVNVHYIAGYGLLARLARLHPIIDSCYGSDLFFDESKHPIKAKIVSSNLRHADAIAATSMALAERAKHLMSNPDADITVTPFGVDIDWFKNEYHACIKDSYQIGIVKYLEPIYDIPLLLRAYALVVKRLDEKISLAIYGDGSLRAELQQLTKQLEIDDSVHFYGNVPNCELPQELAKMDVFVNCSIQESFGVTVVEAMSCGIPVVVTKTAGFDEIVDSGVNGIVLPDREPETMAEAIIRLLRDPQLRMHYSQKGRAKVESQYNWKENVNKLVSLYHQVASY